MMVKSVRLKRKQIHPRRRITPRKQNTKRKKQVGGRRKTSKRKRKQKSKKQYGGQPGGQPVDEHSKRIDLDHSLEVEQYYHGFKTVGDVKVDFSTASPGAYLLFVDSGGGQFFLKIALKKKKNEVEILPVKGVPPIGTRKITGFNDDLRLPIETFISSNERKLKNPIPVRNIDKSLREAFLKRKFPNASQNKDYRDVTTLPYFHFTNLRDIPLNSYVLIFSNFNNLLFLRVRYLDKDSGPTQIYIGIAKTIDGKYIVIKYPLERSVPITGSHLPSIHDVVKFIIADLEQYSAQTEITPFNKDKVLTIKDQKVKLFQSKPGTLEQHQLQKYGKIGDYLIFQKGLDEYEIYYKIGEDEIYREENKTINQIEGILDSTNLIKSLTREELSDIVNMRMIFYELFSKKGKSGEHMLYMDSNKNAEIYYKKGKVLKTSPSFPQDNQQAINIQKFLETEGLLPENFVNSEKLIERDFQLFKNHAKPKEYFFEPISQNPKTYRLYYKTAQGNTIRKDRITIEQIQVLIKNHNLIPVTLVDCKERKDMKSQSP